MIPRKKLPASLAAIAVAVVSVAAPAPLSAQQRDAIRTSAMPTWAAWSAAPRDRKPACG